MPIMTPPAIVAPAPAGTIHNGPLATFHGSLTGTPTSTNSTNFVGVWSLLVIYQDGHVVTSTGFPSKPLCEEAKSYVVNGMSLADKAVADRKAAEKRWEDAVAYSAAVAKWRTTHPCSIVKDQMTCSLPGGQARYYVKERGKWEFYMSGGTIDGVGLGVTSYDPKTEIKQAVCTSDPAQP